MRPRCLAALLASSIQLIARMRDCRRIGLDRQLPSLGHGQIREPFAELEQNERQVLDRDRPALHSTCDCRPVDADASSQLFLRPVGVA